MRPWRWAVTTSHKQLNLHTKQSLGHSISEGPSQEVISISVRLQILGDSTSTMPPLWQQYHHRGVNLPDGCQNCTFPLVRLVLFDLPALHWQTRTGESTRPDNGGFSARRTETNSLSGSIAIRVQCSLRGSIHCDQWQRCKLVIALHEIAVQRATCLRLGGQMKSCKESHPLTTGQSIQIIGPKCPSVA